MDKETEYIDFSVLTNPNSAANLQWVRSNGQIQSGAIKGGRTRDSETIYIGRFEVQVGNERSLIPGFYLQSKPDELRAPFSGGVRKCNNFL